MKLFISWSGVTSQKIALTLREWLPSVIQAVEPYVSSEDIDKGARWSSDISKELEASTFGLICVTPENINAPWINFEAGALSKQIDKSFVSPFLFGVKRSEVNGPLLQFQSTVYDKEDIRKLVISINSRCGDEGLEEKRLEKTLEVWWPNLVKELDNIAHEVSKQDNINGEAEVIKLKTNDDILEEILDLVRTQHKILRTPEAVLPPSYLRQIVNRVTGNNISLAAIRDLDKTVRSLQDILLKYSDSETIPLEEIKRIVAQFDKPINYLTNKTLRMRNEDFVVTEEIAAEINWGKTIV